MKENVLLNYFGHKHCENCIYVFLTMPLFPYRIRRKEIVRNANVLQCHLYQK